MISPVDDLIMPLRSWSAARTGVTAASAHTARAVRLPNLRTCAQCMAFLRWFLLRGCRWGRHRLEKGDDCVDFRRLERELEARHSRRPVGDEVVQSVVLSAQRGLGQDWTVLPARQQRLGVADAA